MNIAVDRVFESGDWIAFVFFLIFAMLAMVKLLFPKRLNSLLGSFFSKNYFIDYASELQEKISLFHFLLFFVQNLILALVLYVFLLQFGLSIAVGFSVYLKFFFGIALYLFFQLVVGKLTASIFRINEIYKGLYLLKFSYLKVVSIYSLPVLLLCVYSFPESDIMHLIALLYIATLLIIRWFLILSNKITLFKANSFYFILYICTLEILPLVLLMKLMVK